MRVINADTTTYLRRWKIATALSLISALFVGLSSSAIADEPQTNTAEWYCHQGALLIHAGQRYSQKTAPLQWDLGAFGKASDDFNECYNRAQHNDEPVTELIAIRGYAAAKIMIAETAQNFSVLAPIVSGPKAKQLFTESHTLALQSARQALQAFDAVDNLMTEINSPDDPESYVQLSDSMQSAKQLVASVKQVVMETTFENAPRSKTEFSVWVSTGRVPSYSVNGDWGLTKEERCPTKETPISVDGDVKQKAPGLTGISVEVGDDGTLRSAHIVQSSGNSDADEAALTDAYHFKYHAATKRCDSVASSTVIWL